MADLRAVHRAVGGKGGELVVNIVGLLVRGLVGLLVGVHTGQRASWWPQSKKGQPLATEFDKFACLFPMVTMTNDDGRSAGGDSAAVLYNKTMLPSRTVQQDDQI